MFDLIVLDLITQQRKLKRPLDALAGIDEKRSFFFLYRGVGTRGKVTMYRFSERMRRIQSQLLTAPKPPNIRLVPVSIYWGRTNEKLGSFARRLVSDQWRASSGLRRTLGVVFTRTDILVHLNPVIDWPKTSLPDRSLPLNLRHVARLLRAEFKQERIVALGPALVTRKSIVHDLATKNQRDPKVIAQRRKIAKRLVANLSYPSMRLLKTALDVFWRKVYDHIELHNVSQIHDLANTHTIIYIPNHRSHIDYLILSYLLFVDGIAIPHIAAGDNLNLPLLGPLLRRCGAFFIRRSFREDHEYRSVLTDYLALLLKDGHSIELFIEGTRSRSGWTLDPRMGLVQMILEAQTRLQLRPVVLVPVYVAYERLIESESYRAELLGSAKQNESLLDAIYAFKLLRQKLGSVQVALGPPIDPGLFTTERGLQSEETEALANHAVLAINDIAILSPTNLIAMAVFSFGIRSVSVEKLAARVDFLRGLLRVESLKHDYKFPTTPSHEIIEHVAELGFFALENDQITITNETLASLAWFRNNTLHTLATPSVLAVVILNQAEPAKLLDILRQVAGLLPHVASVLKFRMDLRTVKRWLTHFKNAQLTVENAAGQSTAASADDADSELRGLANLIMPLLECMYATITCLIERADEIHSREELVAECFNLVRSVTATLKDDAMLVFGRRFFESVVDQLIKFGLVVVTGQNELSYTPNLEIMQRRSTIAIDPAFNEEIRRYFNKVR